MATTKREFDYIEVEYQYLSEQINNWLQTKYKSADILFTAASPHGQIINVQKELFAQYMLYLKNSLSQVDMAQNTTNDKIVKNTAVIAGHNPTRPISASGTLKFILKPGIDITSNVHGDAIILNNGSLMKNKTNSKYYVLDLGSDKVTYPLTPNCSFLVNVLQGKYESQTFTGRGEKNQSVSVNVSSVSKIDNFKFNVYYNGELLKKYDCLYDMTVGEKACYTRTGYNGGIDIFFGTDDFGFIPQLGSSILVQYLITDGTAGDVLNPKTNDFRFIDDVIDKGGYIVDMEELFNCKVYVDIAFSSDGESVTYTKAIIPYVSRNFVLSTPPQFIYHLKRLNMFSKVNAFNNLSDNNFLISDMHVENALVKLKQAIMNGDQTDIINKTSNLELMYSKYKNNTNDNKIYLYLIPDIKRYFNSNVNYFNVPLDAFYLDTTEEEKVMSYLKMLGSISVTTKIEIIQPKITRYVMHVYVRRFDDTQEINIVNQITSTVSDYLITNDRFDRIIKSDIVKILKNIDGIDSVDIYFVSKKNEDYYRTQAALNVTESVKKEVTKIQIPHASTNTTTVTSTPGAILKQSEFKSDLMLGIDPVLGDVIIEKDEYAIVRGGWLDRKGVWYDENVDSEGLKSINVIFNGITKRK